MSAEDRQPSNGAQAEEVRETAKPPAMLKARYVSRQDVIRLKFGSGGIITVPRSAVTELSGVPTSELKRLAVSAKGDVVSCRELEIKIDVVDLIERVFGSRLFLAWNGRRGGRVKSAAKAASSRANGAKGGRPRTRRRR